MAGTPIIVPIELVVQDIDVENVDLSDVKKSINEKLVNTTKAINNVFSKIDLSKVNGAVRNAISQVSKSTAAAYKAQQQFQQAIREAADSSEVYKERLEELHKAQEELKNSKLRKIMATFEDDNGVVRKDLTKDQRHRYEGIKAEYEEQVRLVKEMERALAPENFAMTGSEEKVSKLNAAYQQLLSTLTRATITQRQFNDAVQQDIYTAEYQKKQKELEDLTKKANALIEKSARMDELGTSERSWERLNYDAEILKQKIIEVTDELKAMVEEGKAFTFGGDVDDEISNITETTETLVGALDDAKYEGRSAGIDLRSVFTSLNSACDKVIHSIGRIIKQLGRLTRHSKSTSTDIHKSMRRLWKNFLMFGLGFRSMYFFIKKIRTTAINAIKAMAEKIPEVNVQVSALLTAINQLKGSLGTAFQPILNFVVPALIKLISVLVDASNAVARFFATLTGQGYIYEYTAAEVDYAQSLEDTASAANKAKKSLMGFDTLNRLDDDSTKAEAGTWNKKQLEDLEDIANARNRLAELIKEGWENIDFTDVGEYIAEKIKTALTNAEIKLKGPISNFGNKIATLLSTAINGFTVDLDLARQLGSTVATAINTVFKVVDKFFRDTKWSSLGASIAIAIYTALDKTDFELIGQTIGDYILAGITLWWSALTTFAEGNGFSLLGKKISDAINGFFQRMGEVDETVGLTGWQKLGQAISTTITGLVETIKTALAGVNWDEVGQAIGELIESIDWKQVIIDFGGLVSTIVQSIGETLKGWKKTDPISAGIFTVIIGGILGVKIIAFTESIITLFTEVGTLFADTGGSALLKAGAPGINGAFSKLALGGLAAFDAVMLTYDTTAIVDAAKGYKQAATTHAKEVSDALETYKNLYTTKGKEVADKVAGMIYGIDTTLMNFDEAQAALTEKIESYWDDVPENMWDGFKQGWDYYFGKNGTGLWQLFKDAFDNVIKWLKDLLGIHSPSTVFEGIGEDIGQGLFDGFEGIWEGFSQLIKDAINTIIGFINNLISGVVTGVNSVIDALNGLSFTMPDWLGGASLGFNIKHVVAPQIPLLAQGAVIPPNKEFLAVLGDQKHGTNIEAPMETLVAAFRAASGNDAAEAIVQMGNLILAAIQNQELTAYMDETLVSRSLYSPLQMVAKNRGLSLIEGV